MQTNGCLTAFLSFFLRLFGIKPPIRRTTEMIDVRYREYVDVWVSESLARWLHETRAEIDAEQAAKTLLGESSRFPETAAQIREALIDAKVTFSQRDGKQYLEIEAYMAPRQLNGKQPQILRWHAERAINWTEIPDDVRESMIRMRQPVTLGYSIPQ